MIGWSSIVSGSKGVTEKITNFAQQVWSWNWGKQIKAGAQTTAAFTANTLFYELEQLTALRHSIPGIFSPDPYKIYQASKHIILCDIVPLLTVKIISDQLYSATNNSLNTAEEEAVGFQVAALTAVNLINWSVWIYIHMRQTPQLLAHTSVIDMVGAGALGAHKPPLPPNEPCVVEECNFSRRFKGTWREMVELNLGFWVADGIGYILSYTPITIPVTIPFINISFNLNLSELIPVGLKIGFSGNAIMRAATLERCERHRWADPTLIWALGAPYTFTEMSVDKLFDSTIGRPSFLVYRSLKNILVLVFVHNTTYMSIPYVAPAQGTFVFDPITLFRQGVGTVFDTSVHYGKKLLAPEPNQEPMISLSTVMKYLTRACHYDLETVGTEDSSSYVRMAKTVMLPSMFHSTRNLVQDEVIDLFFPTLHHFVFDLINHVDGKGRFARKVTSIPIVGQGLKASLPLVIYEYFGIATKHTEFLLTLCKDQDFWDLERALRLWLVRHGHSDIFPLAEASNTQLSNLHTNNNNEKKETTSPAEEAKATSIDSPTIKKPIVNLNRTSLATRKNGSTIINRHHFLGKPQTNTVIPSTQLSTETSPAAQM